MGLVPGMNYPILSAVATGTELGLLNQVCFTAQLPNGATACLTLSPYSMSVLAQYLQRTTNLDHACWHFNNQDKPWPCRKCKKP